MPLAVVAIGGNALAQAHQQGTIEEQFFNARIVAAQLIGIIESGWDIVITHGNGPQVGSLLRRLELAGDPLYRLPLDVVDADTQGGIGYMLQQVIGNRLRSRGNERTVVTLVTQVLVAADDPAFNDPQKPIGPFFSRHEAERRMQDLGWAMRDDAGRGWRRLVPSPKPLRIIELDAIRHCIAAGLIPIAAGGGGVPVVETTAGRLQGVPAVIDKDRASSLLASQLGADLLLISTGVPRVQIRFGTPHATSLGDVDAATLRRYHDEGEFPPGSMGPKIEAALDFLAAGGQEVIITDPDNLVAAMIGEAGTRVR